LASSVALVRGTLSGLLRMTVALLIVQDVHAQDVTQQLIDTQTCDHQDFNWLFRMRYYLEPSLRQIKVKMVTTTVDYGHEYLGLPTRLVMTPLTDRC
jgi:dynein heavy chain